MSVPAHPGGRERRSIRSASMGDDAEISAAHAQELSAAYQRRRAKGDEEDDEEVGGGDDEEEGDYDADARPSERLFGRRKARELRQRIVRSRNVTPQMASDALDAASAAISAGGSTETIEFVTWFSVWALIIFYLLFYSSYGPMLWKFLYGPMGLLLALPFGFSILFWLISFVLSDLREA